MARQIDPLDMQNIQVFTISYQRYNARHRLCYRRSRAGRADLDNQAADRTRFRRDARPVYSSKHLWCLAVDQLGNPRNGCEIDLVAKVGFCAQLLWNGEIELFATRRLQIAHSNEIFGCWGWCVGDVVEIPDKGLIIANTDEQNAMASAPNSRVPVQGKSSK